MNKAEKEHNEKEHNVNWRRITISICALISLTLIWILNLNDLISKSLFYVGSLAVIILAFLINYFFNKKESIKK